VRKEVRQYAKEGRFYAFVAVLGPPDSFFFKDEMGSFQFISFQLGDGKISEIGEYIGL